MHFFPTTALFTALVAFPALFTSPVLSHTLSSSLRGSSGNFQAVPYFMPLANNPQPIDEILQDSGIKNLILSFVTSSSKNRCLPVWDGNATQSIDNDTQVERLVRQVRAAGGDVSVSFSNLDGTELAEVCQDVPQLTRAYQKVIDKYNLTNIDFDIEGSSLDRAGEQIRRFQAINKLKENAGKAGKELKVSLVLPADGKGILKKAQEEVKRAVDTGCVIDFYQIMAFDVGTSMPNEVNDLRDIMDSAHEQLANLRPDLNSRQLYAATGMILMNGHSHTKSELFTQQVFQSMVDYAEQNGLGRASFWSLNRDRQCTDAPDWESDSCSNIAQSPYDFAKIISGFNPQK